MQKSWNLTNNSGPKMGSDPSKVPKKGPNYILQAFKLEFLWWYATSLKKVKAVKSNTNVGSLLLRALQ